MADEPQEPLDVAEDATEETVAEPAFHDRAPNAQGKYVFQPGNTYRWKSGQTGNPNGHSAARRLTSELLTLLDEPYEGDPEKRTIKKLLAKKLVAVGLGLPVRTADGKTIQTIPAAASVMAQREIMDRTEGKVPLPFRLSNMGAGGEVDLDIRIETVQSPAVEAYRAGRLPAGGNGKDAEPPAASSTIIQKS